MPRRRKASSDDAVLQPDMETKLTAKSTKSTKSNKKSKMHNINPVPSADDYDESLIENSIIELDAVIKNKIDELKSEIQLFSYIPSVNELQTIIEKAVEETCIAYKVATDALKVSLSDAAFAKVESVISDSISDGELVNNIENRVSEVVTAALETLKIELVAKAETIQKEQAAALRAERDAERIHKENLEKEEREVARLKAIKKRSEKRAAERRKNVERKEELKDKEEMSKLRKFNPIKHKTMWDIYDDVLIIDKDKAINDYEAWRLNVTYK